MMKLIDIKKTLLLGTALVAVSGFSAGAQAADLEAAAAAATPTDLSAVVAADNILNAVDTNTPDGAFVNVNGGKAVTNINYDHTGLLAILDSDATTGEALAASGYFDIADSTTTTVLFGGTVADGSGTDGDAAATLSVAGTLGEDGASTLTRGGSLAVVGAANETSGLGTLSVAGNTLLTNVDVTGGAGGAAEGGTAVNATFGDAATDTFDVTTLDVIGGNGSGAVDSANGGAATVVVNAAATLGGAATVTGGDDAAGAGGGADGGAAVLTFDSNVTSSSTLAVSTGTASAAGTNGSATVNFGGNATFTAITLEEGDSGVATLNFNGADAQTITGIIDGATAANEGVVTISGAGAVTFASAIGATNDIESITLSNEGTGASVIFQANVGVDNANGIVLGDGSGNADTYTATFDTSTAGFTVDGTVQGVATDTSAVVVSGGKTLVQANTWGNAIALDSLSVSGTGTTLDSNATIQATTVTVASGATLNAADVITATGGIANAGTLVLDGAVTQTAAITGAGTLDVDASATVAESIAQTTITVAESADFTVSAAGGARTVTAAIALEDATSDGTDATLALTPAANGIDVTGAITTQIDGEGEITIADGTGAVDFAGNVGTSALKVGALTVAGGGANVVTTTGNLYVNAITMNAADTLQFVGTTAQTVSGDITNGIVIVGNGTDASNVTFNGTSTSLASGSVATGSTANFDGNTTFTGTYTTTGTTTVGVGSTLTAGTIAGAGTYVIDVRDDDGSLTAADFGQVSGTGTIDTDMTSFNVTGFIDTSATADILTTAVFDEAEEISDNSAFYTFTAATDGTITVTSASSASITNTASKAAAIDTLVGVGASATGSMRTVLDNIVSASSSAVDDIIESAISDVAGGGAVAGMTVSNQTASVTNARLASLRSGTTATGMAAGEMAQGLKAWGQAFGTTATQDERDGVSGYDADTIGFAAGLDTEVSDSTILGLALSYANTEVDSDSASNAETDVDSTQLTLYANHDIDASTYVSGQIGYVWLQNDTTRSNVGGVSGSTAKGEYDANQVIVRAEVGRSYDMDGVTVTPSLLANYVHYDADEYTETGAGTSNLTVDADAMNVLEFGLGVDVSQKMEYMDGSMIEPVLKLGVRHDVIGDEFEATNTFTGAGSGFTVKGFDPAQTTFNAGLGLTYFTTDNWEVSAEYDYEFKSDYDAHSGLVKAAYKF